MVLNGAFDDNFLSIKAMLLLIESSAWNNHRCKPIIQIIDFLPEVQPVVPVNEGSKIRDIRKKADNFARRMKGELVKDAVASSYVCKKHKISCG